MFVLAHLSDVHLAPLPKPDPRESMSKRGLGYINWLRKRRAIHRADIWRRWSLISKASRPTTSRSPATSSICR